ncbi:MAG: RhuM protein, partial [Aeriscardovia sp.]|nr:RhuM protein [Aeriscardovia sp.]
MDMMKRDLIVLEHERFELTGYDVWMTAGEIARLFGVTIMKIRGSIRKMERDLKISILNVSRYELLENGYKDDQYNLEAIIAVSYYIDTGLAHEFRHWI